MNNLFLTYHMHFFLSVVRIENTHFYIGQCLFLLYNATNDVIFGWLSDTWASKGNRRSRLPVIRFGGALWAIAFFLVWFPWGGASASPALAGLNWTVNLCVIDTGLTLVEVNHHALLAEISTDSRERASLNSWASLAAAVGSLTSLAGHYFWRRGSGMAGFRAFAFCVSLGAFACFEFAASYLRSINVGKAHTGAKRPVVKALEDDHPGGAAATLGKVMRREPLDRRRSIPSLSIASGDLESKCGPGHVTGQSEVPQERSFWSVAETLRNQDNFLIFAAVSAVQTFDCHLGKNFFVIFLDVLVGDALPPRAHALLVTLAFFLPWCLAAVLSRGIEKSNATLSSTLLSVWKARLVLLAICSSVLVTCSVGSPGVSLWASQGLRCCAAFAILANRVLSECICRLVPLIEGDLIDEHRYSEFQQGKSRDVSMGATLIGTANLISKPSSSLGPMAGFALLSWAVPELRGHQAMVEAQSADALTLEGEQVNFAPNQRSSVAWVVVALPLTCVLIQLLLWQKYSLKGKHLIKIKSFLASVLDGGAV